MSVLVAGAGPTGLIAARALADRGHDVLLIDQAPAVGGMSSSFEIAGQSVDFGSHRLHGRADPKLLDELRELLGEDLQRRDRNGRIRLLGRWVAFPLRFRDLLNWPTAVVCCSGGFRRRPLSISSRKRDQFRPRREGRPRPYSL